MKHSKLIAVGLLASASALMAQPVFVAGWDFDNTNGVEVVNAQWGVQKNAASFYWNGSGASTDFASLNPPISFVAESQFSGSDAAVGNQFVVVDAETGFNEFSDNFGGTTSHLQFLGNGGGLNSQLAVIEFSAANLIDLSIQFAAFNNGAGLVDFTYSTDGVNFLALQTGSNYGSTFEVDTIDLSVLDGASTAYIGVGFTNAGNDVFAFDNIQITGTTSAIPEPSAFAALAGVLGLGFAVSRRRSLRK